MQDTPKETLEDAAGPEEKEEGKYYYDDAHGYEEFDPESEEEDPDEGADLSGGAFNIDLD